MEKRKKEKKKKLSHPNPGRKKPSSEPNPPQQPLPSHLLTQRLAPLKHVYVSSAKLSSFTP